MAQHPGRHLHTRRCETWNPSVLIIGQLGFTVRSLIKLNANVTYWLPEGTATTKENYFYCFYGATWLVSGKPCSSRRWVIEFQPGVRKWQLRSTLSVNTL
jgi:hypothetical protein